VTTRKFKFIKASIEALAAPGYHYDTEVRGLCLRVNADGSKTFYFYRRVKSPNGFESKPERVKIGRFPDLTIEQARTKAEQINAAVSNGEILLTQRRAYRDSPTLEDLFQRYMNHHFRKKRKKVQQTERDFYRWFGHWRDRKAIAITRDDVETFHEQVGLARGRYSANRGVELLRAIFNKASQWGITTGTNPASHMTLFTEVARERVLREDELARFFQALNTEPNLDLRDFVILTLFTGQRKSNVLAMRWADIDFAGKAWRIPAEQMKNSQSLAILLTQAELEILERRHTTKKNAYVFPGTGRTGHFIEPKKPWHKLLERAEISDFHLHDLRRSLASYMASTGANVAIIKNALNHKDIQTTLNVYARTAKTAELEARQKAHDRMLELADAGCPLDNVVPFRRPADRQST